MHTASENPRVTADILRAAHRLAAGRLNLVEEETAVSGREGKARRIGNESTGLIVAIGGPNGRSQDGETIAVGLEERAGPRQVRADLAFEDLGRKQRVKPPV
jgi:hypothetical protein